MPQVRSSEFDDVHATRTRAQHETVEAPEEPPSVDDQRSDGLRTLHPRAAAGTTRQPQERGAARATAEDARDILADARDLAALERDAAADARDAAMSRVDSRYERDANARAVTGAEIVIRAAEQRRRAAWYRTESAEHRARAAEDRAAAARDREQAARDRRQARADRARLSGARAPGAVASAPSAGRGAAGSPAADCTHGAPLGDLDRELDRCRRDAASLVVARIDIAPADAHAEADAEADAVLTGRDGDPRAAVAPRLLRALALVERCFRSYDLVIALDDHTIACALPDVTAADARQRVGAAATTLQSSLSTAVVMAGLAQLRDDEAASDLLARAGHDTIPTPSD